MAKQKEAWDKLSMQEKALLIKLSVDNGVSSLKLIRDTYNLYSNGGDLVHKHDGNLDTQYLRTEQPEVVMPVTGKTADTSWYEWWFANRQKQLHQNIETVKKNDRERDFTKYFIAYPNAEEDTKRMIKALGETKEYVGNAGMMEDSIGNSLARKVLASDIADYTPNISDDDVNLYLSYLQNGVHLPVYNSILYPGKWESPSKMTVTHERAHAADAFFPRAVINYFTTAGEVNPEKYDTWYKRIFAPLHPKYPLGIYPSSGKRDSYLDNPNEVYSRLMEFRQFVGANPNYTWTKDDLKKYEPALNKFELRRYSDNDILKLLNEIAQNNSGFQKSENTYLAAFGGPLTHKKSTGGPLYPFSFEKNPFLKTPVVRYDDGGEIVNINLPEVTVFPEESYITYTGNESKSFIPTKEEYNEFKANEIRRQALVNMNNRNTPIVPYINNDPAKPGNSCLYTFLSNYPVPLEKSNRVFWELSPEESGFKRVDTALPGDGIQVFSKPQPHRWGSYFWPATHLGAKLKHGYRFPSHMTMFKDINTNGVLIRGSNGSTNPIDTSAIVEERKPISYIHPYNADIYRFVGTKKLLKAWEKEYNNIYKHGNN